MRDVLKENKKDASAMAMDNASKSGPSAAARTEGAVAQSEGKKRKRGKKDPASAAAAKASPANENIDALAGPAEPARKKPKKPKKDVKSMTPAEETIVLYLQLQVGRLQSW